MAALKPQTLNARVKRGAAFLDRHFPGWAHRVKASALDMDDCLHCILGQCFGDFYAALVAIRGRGADAGEYASDWDVAHGFQVEAAHHGDGTYERLGLTWRPVLMARKAKKRTPSDKLSLVPLKKPKPESAFF